MKLFVWRLCVTSQDYSVKYLCQCQEKDREQAWKQSPMLNMFIEIFCCFERGVAYICAINAWSLHFIHFNMNCNFILRKMDSTKFQTYYNQHTKTLTAHFPACNKEFMTPITGIFCDWVIHHDCRVEGLVGDWHTQKQLACNVYIFLRGVQINVSSKKINNFIH